MAAKRQLVSSGGPFETKYGYCRAVRVGDVIAVAGTAAYKDGAVFAPGDAAAQTRYILEVIAGALTNAGATTADVIRYRVFLTDIADYPEVGTELGRVFGGDPPRGNHGRQHATDRPGSAGRDRSRRDRRKWGA